MKAKIRRVESLRPAYAAPLVLNPQHYHWLMDTLPVIQLAEG